MGIFTRKQKDTTENIYEKYIKKQLKEKDGSIHVLIINDSGERIIKKSKYVDNSTTQLINTIISAMQRDRYEIVDIKFNNFTGQGIDGGTEFFRALVMYK